jgi:hypothetical protein
MSYKPHAVVWNISNFSSLQHLQFREKYGADTILEDYTPPPLFEECLAGGYFGEDVDGHPVWYDNFGNLDSSGI